MSTEDKEGNTMHIEIRLDDQCENGYEDFSITGTIYEKDKPCSDKYIIHFGAIHGKILEIHPELKIFTDIHSSDFNGTPTYPVDNGFYHLKKDKNVFKRYMRFDSKKAELFKQVETKDDFKHVLRAHPEIMEDWKTEADIAIKWLEEKTGKKFCSSATRNHFSYNPL